MKKIYPVEELDCANCAAKMERAIAELDGIVNANMNFLTQKLTIEFADGADVSAIMKQVQKLCRKIEPDCRIML